MNILALESSAKTTSVAVGTDREILAEYNASTKLTHSQTLMPMLDGVLRCAGLVVGDMDYFAVSAGPGSFTGLRIGIGAVKGLAFGAQKPCVAVSTLEALSQNLPGVEGIICAVMDARCGQVYTASFESGPATISRLTPDEAVTIEQMATQITALSEGKKNVFFVGDGAELCYTKLNGRMDRLFLAGEGARHQKAASVILAARQSILAGEATDAATLAPVYLRLPEAQRKLQKQT